MVDLIKMTHEDYSHWLENAVREYAEDHIKDRRWTPEEALEESGKEFDSLLPNGLDTEDNYLFSIVGEQGEKVGYLWFAVRGSQNNRHAFVFDFVIFEPYRRHGYGSQAFLALEDEVRSHGLNSIKLHVFGHNKPARELYTKLGYVETNVQMSKDLDRRELFSAPGNHLH